MHPYQGLPAEIRSKSPAAKFEFHGMIERVFNAKLPIGFSTTGTLITIISVARFPRLILPPLHYLVRSNFVTNIQLQLTLIAIGTVLLVGCQQGRYEPAKWRPALETNTLPISSGDTQPQVSATGTLPMRQSTLPRSSTLPRLSTLPGRSTLPMRNARTEKKGLVYSSGKKQIWDTSDKKTFYSPRTYSGGNPILDPTYRRNSTLPQRTGTLPQRGSTLPKRVVSGSSLQLPDHMVPLRRNSTLPIRSFRRNSTLPVR